MATSRLPGWTSMAQSRPSKAPRGEAAGLQVFAQPGGGLLLPEGHLRVGVQTERELDELLAAAVDLGDDPLLELVAVRHRPAVLSSILSGKRAKGQGTE